MKISFFSWSAVGIVLAACCFLSSCKKDVALENTGFLSKPVLLYFNVVSPSFQSLVGREAGKISPEMVKLSDMDNKFYRLEYSGEGWLHLNRFPDGTQDTVKYNVRGQTIFYLHLTKNNVVDIDTIVFDDSWNSHTLFNGEVTKSGYFIKKND